MEFYDCPHCGTKGVILMSDGNCPNCKKNILDIVSQKVGDKENNNILSHEKMENEESSYYQDVPIDFDNIFKFGILKKERSTPIIIYHGGFLSFLGLLGIFIYLCDRDAKNVETFLIGGISLFLIGLFLCLFGVHSKFKNTVKTYKNATGLIIDKERITYGKFHYQIEDGIISVLQPTSVKSFLFDKTFFLNLHYSIHEDNFELTSIDISGKYKSEKKPGYFQEPDHEFFLFKDNNLLHDFKTVSFSSNKDDIASYLSILDELGKCIISFSALPLKVHLVLLAPRNPNAKYYGLALGGIGTALAAHNQVKLLKQFKQSFPSTNLGILLSDIAGRYNWGINIY